MGSHNKRIVYVQNFTNLDRVVNFDDMLLNANSGAISWYLG